MAFPLISVVIPTFNSGKTIQKALDSVVHQSYKNREILIIDGKSTDNTLEIVQKSKDPFLRIYSEKDRGIYDAINKGIKYSHGEWIFILGSDDWLASLTVLEQMSRFLSAGLDFVYGSVVSDGRMYGGEFSPTRMLNQNICQQCIFYKRSIFEAIGFFDENYALYADYVFNVQVFASGRFKTLFVDIVVAHYSREGASSKKIDIQLCFNYLEVMRPLAKTKEQQKILMDRWPYAGIDLYKNGYRLEGIKLLVKCVLSSFSFRPVVVFLKALAS